jgi:hypothetical protein
MVERLPRLITVPINFLFVTIGWALFRSADLDRALAFLGRLFVAGVPAEREAPLLVARILSHRGLTMMVLAALICFLPAFKRPARIFEFLTGRDESRLAPATGLSLALFVLSFFSLANSGYNPFIYFRF